MDLESSDGARLLWYLVPDSQCPPFPESTGDGTYGGFPLNIPFATDCYGIFKNNWEGNRGLSLLKFVIIWS